VFGPACVAVCLTVLVANSFAAELIVNGDFATGNFNGWSVSNMSISQSDGGITKQSGSGDPYFAFTGKNGLLSQTINTVAGFTYTLSFIANNNVYNLVNANDTGEYISASYDNNLIFKDINGLKIPQQWRTLSGQFTATSNQTTLQIAMWFDKAVSQGYIDKISVVGASSVPEPSTYALFGFGALALIIVHRCRHRSGNSLTSSTQEELV